MEPFVQISKLRGTNATLNGTGLGLSISKRLAEKMGGKIYIESDIGKGSTFYITMANVRLNSDVSNLIKDIQINEESKSLPSSVLIVDDVEMNLKVMQAMCSKIGIKNITCMKSPKDALNTSKEIDFDVIFTDFWMPEFSGVEFAKRIKSFNKKIPVIAVTADIEIKDSTDIQFFDGVLFKPVTIQKIKDAINKINTSTDTQQVN